MSAPRELRRNEWVTIAEAAVRMATNEHRVRRWTERKPVNERNGKFLYRDLEQIEFGIRAKKKRRAELTSAR